MKFAISIGHTSNKQGAHFGLLYEYLFNTLLAQEISCYITSKNNECFIVQKDGMSNDEVCELIDYHKPIAVIELHANAYNGKVSGTETLYTNNHFRSSELARIIQTKMCEVLKRKGKKDRGLKQLHSGDRGYRNLINYKTPAIITEPLFIDCESDLILGISKGRELAQFIAEGLIEYGLFAQDH